MPGQWCSPVIRVTGTGELRAAETRTVSDVGFDVPRSSAGAADQHTGHKGQIRSRVTEGLAAVATAGSAAKREVATAHALVSVPNDIAIGRSSSSSFMAYRCGKLCGQVNSSDRRELWLPVRATNRNAQCSKQTIVAKHDVLAAVCHLHQPISSHASTGIVLLSQL
jgi:hypothetical protein